MTFRRYYRKASNIRARQTEARLIGPQMWWKKAPKAHLLWPDSHYLNVRMVKCFYLGSISVRNYIRIQGHIIDFIFCKKLWNKFIFMIKSNWYRSKNIIHLLKWNILFCLCRQNDFYWVNTEKFKLYLNWGKKDFKSLIKINICIPSGALTRRLNIFKEGC